MGGFHTAAHRRKNRGFSTPFDTFFKRDLTQEQLAIQVDVRRKTIMRLEKYSIIPLKFAINISGPVGAPIEEIDIFK